MVKELIASVALLCLVAVMPAYADSAYPEFTAHYTIKTNGIKTATAVFTLTRDEQGNYLYQQQAQAVGLASMFSPGVAIQSSHWRFIDKRIVVSEFKSQRDGGDDDDNAELVFDWESLRVKNVGAGEQWDIAMPAGTLDILVMQLAMSLDLIRGEKVFEYPVAIRGRIKQFQFKQVAQEPVEFGMGTYDAVKVRRMDDDKDKSWTWSVPELNYFPVRFVKHKSNGLKVEILLEKLALKTLAQDSSSHSSPESAPAPAVVPAVAASRIAD
jgi:hypothetical protein